MKDLKLHAYISLFFATFFCITSIIIVSLFMKNETIIILDQSMNRLKNEVKIITKMTSELVNLNSSKETIISVLQKTVTDIETENTFVSIINWTGDFVCYPDITKVGQNASNKSSIDYEQGINGFKLYEYFKNKEVLNTETPNNEIISLHYIDNSDLLITCHIKTNEISLKIKTIRNRAYLAFLILGFILLLLLNAMIRIVSNYYNKILEGRVLELEFNAGSLADLNESFKKYQEKTLNSENELMNTVIEDSNESVSKERFLTYVRNELVSISTKDIAYIYVQNTITYIIRKDGKLSTSNETLDKIYNTLDQKAFFKVNRQFIISISSIKKIVKFENSKLKLEVNPTSEIDIIIGKNKASSFKQWLDL